MSTPLKALIQERLRAKMVCRGAEYDLDDFYECNSASVDVPTYDINSRGDEDHRMRNMGSRKSTSRRSSAPQDNCAVQLHTHIDPSAYLVPSQKAPSTSYGSSQGDHNRHRYSRYHREQYRDASVYDHYQQHHQRDQRQRQNNHHRIRELPPRHEHPPRRVSRQQRQNCASISPWHRSEHGSPRSKSSAMTRSTFRAESSPVDSPSLHTHRKHSYDYNDQDNFSRHGRDINSSPRIATSASSSHLIYNPEYHQRQQKSRNQDYDNQSACEVREPTSTYHHDHFKTPEKPVRRSPMAHKHPIQSDNANFADCRPSVVSPRKLQSEEFTPPDVTKEPGRHSTPQLDMEIIDPPAKAISRTRGWDGIMSPESRLAAKAFVEKRQRRSEKSTPRTMATQRWLEVIDARASRRKDGV